MPKCFHNLLFASLSLSACWIFPELYGYLKEFIRANVWIATLNLLPAYPLDGGRLCRRIFSGKGARFLTNSCTFLLGLASLIFSFLLRAPSLSVFGSFLLSYFFVFCLRRVTRLTEDAPLYALARTDEEGRFLPARVERKGRPRRKLTPTEITRLCLTYPRETTIGEALAAEERGGQI